MEWDDLEAAYLGDRLGRLPTEELRDMICRAQTPDQFNWLASAFALQGETALWMHTIDRALRVLCNPDKLARFINDHFLPFSWQTAHSNIEPHVMTMQVFAIVRLNYRSTGNRTAEQLMLGPNVGTRHLIPRACEEGNLTAR